VDALSCSRCGAACDLNDNFCRRCGHDLSLALPALRPPSLPARPRTIPPSLVGSVAVLALGTGLEWLARRAAGTAARAAGRALVGGGQERTVARPRRSDGNAAPDAIDVDEVLYIRKVQLRR
jgi:hypothetical protein